MPTYLTQFSYTRDAWKNLVKNPEDREAAVKKLIESQGGKLLHFYYSFGDYDGLLIAEAPDSETLATVILTVASAGHLNALKTTQLFSMEEGLKIMGRANKLAYAAPKG